MAFKRNSFTQVLKQNSGGFATKYSMSKVYEQWTGKKFDEGSELYIMLLGLDQGFYETPCHTLKTHKVDGQTVGFRGSPYNSVIKCKGIDEDGNRVEALCCKIARLEKERIPDKNDSAKRVMSFPSSKLHIPILILGSTAVDPSKGFPVSQVNLGKDLANNTLKFSYLEMASSSFQTEILNKYADQLKNADELDYSLAPDSEEFFTEMMNRLSRTIIKVKGCKRQGFNAILKDYTSFFSFDSAKAIARESGEEERNLIVNYKENDVIVEKVSAFLTLFDTEVDSLIKDWNEKDLQEYYNSVIGNNLKAPIAEKASAKEEEVVEVIEEEEPVTVSAEDEAEVSALLNSSSSLSAAKEEPKAATSEEAALDSLAAGAQETSTDLDDFAYDIDGEDDFFA